MKTHTQYGVDAAAVGPRIVIMGLYVSSTEGPFDSALQQITDTGENMRVKR